LDLIGFFREIFERDFGKKIVMDKMSNG